MELTKHDEIKLHEIKNINGEPVKIAKVKYYIDGCSIIIKPLNNSKDYLLEYESSIKLFFAQRDYKVKQNPNSVFITNELGLDIYFGKVYYKGKQQHSLKIEARGKFWIYSECKKIIYDLIQDLKNLLTSKGIAHSVHISRADIATLIFAEDIESIVSNFEANRLESLSSLKPERFYHYEDPRKKGLCNAVYWKSPNKKSNRLKQKLYDKSFQISEAISDSDMTVDYFNFYNEYDKEAQKNDLIMFRFEIAINCKNYLSDLTTSFLNGYEDYQETLNNTIKRYGKYHRIRQRPLTKKGLPQNSNRNSAKWKPDPIFDFIFFNYEDSYSKPLIKIDLNSKAKSKQVKTKKSLEEEIEVFTKRISKLNPNYGNEELDYIYSQIYLKYTKHSENIIETTESELLQEEAYLLSITKSEDEKSLIKSHFENERKRLL